MTPEAEAVLHYQIDRVLRRYGIADFGPVGELRYGVWQMRNEAPYLIREHLTHQQATDLVRRLQTEAIIQLIEEAERARSAD